jgi:hypothetical protein
MRLEVQHVQLLLTTLDEWLLPNTSATPAASGADEFSNQDTKQDDPLPGLPPAVAGPLWASPLAPIDIALEASAPQLATGALELYVTMTPIQCALQPRDIAALQELIATLNGPPPTPPSADEPPAAAAVEQDHLAACLGRASPPARDEQPGGVGLHAHSIAFLGRRAEAGPAWWQRPC